jgi:D-glycero-alpha-D-manno-heptose-7-phosphate kinase
LIITKTPLRLTLGGGGTDIDKFYKQHGYGMWISGAVNKYIYIIVKDRFEKEIRVSYSKTEVKSSPEFIEHPIIREVLKDLGLKQHLEIAVLSELPSRSGMGSSGAFTIGLVNALSKYLGLNVLDLPNYAYKVEHDMLRGNVGLQDFYIAAYGGVRKFQVTKGDLLSNNVIGESTVQNLENHLSLFFTGVRRTANNILKSQQEKEGYLEDMKKILDIGERSVKAIEKCDMVLYGSLLDEHWHVKRSTADDMTNKGFDKMYKWACENGAFGGKIIGAGGGGYFMFCSKMKKEFERKFQKQFKISPTQFRFVNKGSEVYVI